MKLPMFIVRWIGNRIIPKAQAGKYDKRDVGDGKGSVFFWRHRVFRSKCFAVFLHEFVRGDGDRCLHDHPWPFVTLILRAGYWEAVSVPENNESDAENYVYWREVGRVLYRPATFAHRIDLDPYSVVHEKPWSLVFVGPKIREWGFFTVNGWKAWITGQPNPICATDAFDNARNAAVSQGFDVALRGIPGDLTKDEIAEYQKRHRFDVPIPARIVLESSRMP